MRSPAMRKAAEGAASTMRARAGNAAAQAAVTSSNLAHAISRRHSAAPSRTSQRQDSHTAPSGGMSRTARCARPSALTVVPSVSLNGAAGSDQRGAGGGAGRQVVERDDAVARERGRIGLEDHGDLAACLFERTRREQSEAEIVGRARGEEQPGVAPLPHQRRRDGSRRLENRQAGAAEPGDDQGPLRAGKRRRHAPGHLAGGVGEPGHRLRRGIERVRHREAEPGEIVRGGTQRLRRDVVEGRGVRRGDRHRASRAGGGVAHRRVVPCRDAHPVRPGESGAARGLAQSEGEARRRVRHVLAQHQNGVGLLGLGERADRRGRRGDHVAQRAHQRVRARVPRRMEILRPHQGAQREVRLERGAGRADADRPPAAQQRRRAAQRSAGILGARRGTDAVRRVDEVRAIAAAVADEVAVDRVVVAVEHAAQPPFARVRPDVAAQAAMRADRRRAGQVPLAHVVPRERLVGEHAGRADLGQIAGEGAFQHARLRGGRNRRDRGRRARAGRARPHGRDRTARSDSTRCSGSSRGSGRDRDPGCDACASGSGSGDRCGRSGGSCPAGGIRRPPRRPGSRAGG